MLLLVVRLDVLRHDAERYGQGQLQLQLDHLGAALSSFKASRAYKDIRAASGCIGTIDPRRGFALPSAKSGRENPPPNTKWHVGRQGGLQLKALPCVTCKTGTPFASNLGVEMPRKANVEAETNQLKVRSVKKGARSWPD
jgi:hypothetical protein